MVTILSRADLNGYINPDVTTETTQTLQGVNFSWTSPNLEAVPRWKIKNAGESFSLIESLQGSGIDTITHINRNYHNNHKLQKHLCLWAIILFLSPARVLANTTVASPSSNAQGVVNNNATMITPSSLPQNRYSQGIVCTSPSLTITPYLTDAWSFNRPIETVTKQPIYDEDTGAIKYIQETPRFEKE